MAFVGEAGYLEALVANTTEPPSVVVMGPARRGPNVIAVFGLLPPLGDSGPHLLLQLLLGALGLRHLCLYLGFHLLTDLVANLFGRPEVVALSSELLLALLPVVVVAQRTLGGQHASDVDGVSNPVEAS